MTTQMIVRIEPDLKAQVSRLAKAEGKTVSEIVRELLNGYVKDRDMGGYVDDLWGRIGAKLDPQGNDPTHIQKVIEQSRQ